MSFIQWLKKYFVPHEYNEYKPHSLRTESAIVVLVLILLIEVFFFADPFYLKRTNFFATILQNVLVSETNVSRASNDLALLTEDPLLNTAAKLKAEDMAKNGYFAHVSPTGIEPWHWFEQAGYKYSYAGENLAINFSDSEDVIRAWLKSPAHRANIMNQHFTEIGIGIAHGKYQNQETTFVVQMFGKPIRSHVAIAPKPVSPISIPPTELATTNTVATATGTGRTAVLGETSEMNEPIAPVAPSPWKVFTSPNKVSEFIYILLMAIISMALLLNIFEKAKPSHFRLILNGAFLLFVLTVVIVLNQNYAIMNSAIF